MQTKKRKDRKEGYFRVNTEDRFKISILKFHFEDDRAMKSKMDTVAI